MASPPKYDEESDSIVLHLAHAEGILYESVAEAEKAADYVQKLYNQFHGNEHAYILAAFNFVSACMFILFSLESWVPFYYVVSNIILTYHIVQPTAAFRSWVYLNLFLIACLAGRAWLGGTPVCLLYRLAQQ
jgi:hypothetical protein